MKQIVPQTSRQASHRVAAVAALLFAASVYAASVHLKPPNSSPELH